MMTKHELAVRQACAHYKYRWPPELWTGVMFFDGCEISIEEFSRVAALFKPGRA